MVSRIGNFKLIALLAAIFFIAAIYAALVFQAPVFIENKIVQTLKDQGYQDIHISERSAQSNTLILKNIKLDVDEFSTIKEITVHYNVFKSLVFGHLNKIHIIAPSITTTLKTQDIGHLQRHFLSGLFFQQSWIENVDTLEISQGKIDVLTHEYGGFRFEFDGQVRPSEDKGKNFQFNVSASQKQLSSKIRINGKIEPDNGWHMDIALDRSRLDLPQFQLTRINGRITADGRQEKHYSNGELNIGGFKVGELAWGDIAMTFEQNSEDGMKWIIAGNALGSKDVEFGLNYNEKDSTNIHGTLYTKELSYLLSYLNNQAEIESFEGTRLAEISDVFVTYSLPFSDLNKTEKNIIFHLKKIEENIEIKGNLSIKEDGFNIQALLGPNVIQNVNISNGATLKSGILKGAITYDSTEKNGEILTALENGVLGLGPLNLFGITTQSKFTKFDALGMKSFIETGFRLPMKLNIIQNGRFEYKIDDGALNLKNLKLSIFDGTVTAAPIRFKSHPNVLKINLSDISLKDIGQAFSIDDLASGNIEGQGDLEINANSIKAKSLILTSKRSGKIQMPESLLDALFDTSTLEQETMREALKNFRYESLKIEINGDLNDRPTIKASSKGRNPDILGGRSMTLNFEVEKDIAPLWSFLASTDDTKSR